MKKLFIIAALLGATYYYTFGAKNPLNSLDNSPKSPIFEEEENGGEVSQILEFLTKYANRLIVDKDGFWMLVKDGKLFTPASLESLQEWQRLNPEIAAPVNVGESIWINHGQQLNSGSF